MVGKWWGQYSNSGLSDPKLADLTNLERQYREAVWTSVSMTPQFALHLFLLWMS